MPYRLAPPRGAPGPPGAGRFAKNYAAMLRILHPDFGERLLSDVGCIE